MSLLLVLKAAALAAARHPPSVFVEEVGAFQSYD